MKKISLVDVCDFQGGSQPPKEEWIDHATPGYIRMLQIRDFTQSEKVSIEYVKETKKLKQCVADDILIGRYGASVGKILTGLSGAYNVAIIKTIPKEDILSKRYLFYYLNSPYFQNYILSVGARAAQAGFNKEDLLNAMIPLPKLDMQHQIANILDKISNLIVMRKQQLAKLDELVKARFVEMFGDPVRNGKNWPIITLGELAEIRIGPFGSLLHKEDYIEGGHALVNPSHIVDGKIVIDPQLTISDQKYEELSVYALQKEDIVLGRRGEMGRCAVVHEEGLLCGTGSMIIRLGEQMKPYFLQTILSSPGYKKVIEDKAVGVTMQNLNIPIVSALTIPLLPLGLQEQYIEFIQKIDGEKLTIHQGLDKLEMMKKALMQEYFG